MRTDRFGKPEMQRSYRGPIFARDGSTYRDWDVLGWTPIYKAALDTYQLTAMDVMQGSEKFFGTLRGWMGNLKERIVTSAETQERELQRKTDEISRDGRDYLWSLANKTGETGYHWVTKEERIAAEKKIKERKRGFEGYYNPYKVFR